MSDIDYTTAAESLATELENEGVEADVDELEADIRTNANEYGLRLEEAVRTVASNRKPSDGDINPFAGNSSDPAVSIADIEDEHEAAGTDEDGEDQTAWVTIEAAQVMGTWQADHSSIKQKAEIADETGRTVVTVWVGDDQPTFEEGDVVRLQNVPTDEYQGRYTLNIAPGRSTVEQTDADVSPADDTESVSGRVVRVQDGLIKRCAEEDCSRTLQNGNCSEHGAVDHEYDLRLKVTLDDGVETHEINFNREAVEDLMDTTLEAEIEVAQDALDTEVPGENMAEELLTSQMMVEGPEMYGYILAEEFGLIGTVGSEAVNEALVEAREARSAL
ncbi:replication factor A [Haloarcula sp. 1CSR25-25]|uniref:replication factor A n=1 Tax=Haloarcula sp. 1CSR25-25 TaxID=2862545 RepID=UPI002895543B|nr:replication factor A [Haloarcula sp. 1CSR25-25]MDT3437802.1 replication factor A [Haloarcula sp. 1CSR25-25]